MTRLKIAHPHQLAPAATLLHKPRHYIYCKSEELED